MKSISFFSYKGGVGRTMALTNIAMKLVEFGKSVFIIDFDLEAPGVPFKLTKYLNRNNPIKAGVVDYIYEFSENGYIDELSKYVFELPKNNPSDEKMWLLPAGNADFDGYWNKLSRINWHNLFYNDGEQGLEFFLDLREKIQRSYNPDFLLIDSRTGITELSGISLKILADEVVVLFINNEENIKGTEKVLSFLNDNTEVNDKSLKVHLILTRVPHHKKNPIKFNQEYKLISNLKQQFSTYSNNKEPEVLVIHTDERLQMNEKLAFSTKLKGDDNSPDIYSEHINVFEKLFKDEFSSDEWENYLNATKATKLYNKATNNIIDPTERILLLSEAIQYVPNKWEYYHKRAHVYQMTYEFEKAAADFKKSYELSNSNNHLKDYAWALLNLRKYENALQLVEQALQKEEDITGLHIKAIILKNLNLDTESQRTLNYALTLFPNSHELLNARADLLRKMKRYKEALVDIFKAIEVYPIPYYYATLAEIYAGMGKNDEFYINLSTALAGNLDLQTIRTARDAYEKYRADLRFIEIMKSYNINPEDIFKEGPPTPIDFSDDDKENETTQENENFSV